MLAAGHGTRMRSARPKPLHRLCGRPMILHVLDALAELPVDRVVVVVGPPGRVGDQDPDRARASRAWPSSSSSRSSSGGPVTPCRWPSPGCPTRRTATTATWWCCRATRRCCDRAPWPHLVRVHRATDDAATLLTAVLDDPTGYGRVVRGRDDAVARVVEHGDATDEQLEVREVNTSMYCFKRSVLAPSLRRLSPANAQGEYYLTDVVEVLYEAGHRVGSVVVEDTMEVAGVNDRAQLAVAEAELRDRINERWMRRGVTMWDPADHLHRHRGRPGHRRRPPARGHPPGGLRGGRARRDRPGHPPGRHHGGGGRGGHLQRLPAVGHRPRRPGRAVRRPGRGHRGARRRRGRPGAI